MKTLRVTALAGAIALVLAGCSSTSLDQNPADSGSGAKTTTSGANTGSGTAGLNGGANTANTTIDPLTDPHNILSHQSIYFEFNKSVIPDNEIAIVAAHARFLVDNPTRTVRIEGNTDERGTAEYNLALGQRRADAVRSRMELLGVPANRVDSVSYGKERPRALCHEEKCWVENRRADIVYTH